MGGRYHAPMKRLASLLVLAAPLAASACITEESSSVVRAKPGMTQPTYGAVVMATQDDAWAATQRVLLFMGNEAPEVDGSAMRASANVRGAQVVVKIERYDSVKSVVRIAARRGDAEDRDVADLVLAEIMALLRG